MHSIDYFIEALKAGWIRRIFDENNKGLWKEFYLEKLDIFGGIVSLECNLHAHDCYQIAKNNMFLRDILAGWCKIKSTQAVGNYLE